MFNLPLSEEVDFTFNPEDKEVTFHFKSWKKGIRQLSLSADEALALVQLIRDNAEKIIQAIEV